jgi:hypothetical protein
MLCTFAISASHPCFNNCNSDAKKRFGRIHVTPHKVEFGLPGNVDG